MANYTIFDEQYYLAQYPWVQPAIDAEIITSGRDHFEKFGQAAGLTQVSRYFDEATYLAGNPDIAALVRTPNNPNAPFATGLDHFIQDGYEAGRTSVSPEYDEAFYLANNPRLQPLIENGTFKNGYQHFIQFGLKEGKFGTSFYETEYLKSYPDVRQLVESGALKTGREHYFNFGKNEPNRFATFMGTSGNDMITGAGVGNTRLIGVEVVGDELNGDPFVNRPYGSQGTNEFDTLTGGSGPDVFVLSITFLWGSGRQTFLTNPFYTGPGFATIRNFTPGQDAIMKISSTPLLVFPINNNRDLAIQRPAYFTYPPDTIAVIEGGGNLTLNQLGLF